MQIFLNLILVLKLCQKKSELHKKAVEYSQLMTKVNSTTI